MGGKKRLLTGMTVIRRIGSRKRLSMLALKRGGHQSSHSPKLLENNVQLA